MKKLVLAVAIASMALSAQASTTTFSNYFTWLDNVPGTISTDTFNSYDFSGSSGHSLYSKATLGGITYSSDSQLFGIAESLNYDAAYHASNYLQWQGGSNTLTISLGGNAQAFSFTIGQFDGTSTPFHVSLSNGDSFTITGGPAYTFFGVVSTSAFKTITISGPGLPTIDNVSVGTIAAVPEPESYAMLLAGLGLMGVVARRRGSKR